MFGLSKRIARQNEESQTLTTPLAHCLLLTSVLVLNYVCLSLCGACSADPVPCAQNLIEIFYRHTNSLQNPNVQTTRVSRHPDLARNVRTKALLPRASKCVCRSNSSLTGEGSTTTAECMGHDMSSSQERG